MKILVFSDLHAHPFKLYATIDENGLNSRLNDALRCIDLVCETAERFGVDLILFGGDLFHVRKNITVSAFNEVYERIARLSKYAPVIMIHGNHDQADRAGSQYSIYSFRDIATIVNKPKWLTVKGQSNQEYDILAVPYLEDVSKLGQLVNTPPGSGNPRIFLGHLGIQGALAGADFVYNNVYDAKLDDLKPENFDVGFLGHFHIYQDLGHNFFYIGAPIQHNWGDKGQERGVVVYDTETKTHERIVFDTLPQFMEINYQGPYVHSQFKNNYVRVLYSGEKMPDVEYYKKEWKARIVEAVPIQEQQLTAPRLVVAPGAAIQDALPEYISAQQVTGLDEAYLLQIAREVLEEVEQE